MKRELLSICKLSDRLCPTIWQSGCVFKGGQYEKTAMDLDNFEEVLLCIIITYDADLYDKNKKYNNKNGF